MEAIGLAELSAAEIAVITTAFAIVAALLTIIIMKDRDRRLAKKAQASPQARDQQVVPQPTAQAGVVIGVAPMAIPGYCPNCGMATRPMASFCDKCGRRLLQG